LTRVGLVIDERDRVRLENPRPTAAGGNLASTALGSVLPSRAAAVEGPGLVGKE
jgi:hypothetical protein